MPHICIERTYKTLNYPNFQTGDECPLTGIRRVANSRKVYISGFYVTLIPTTTSFIYKGCTCGKGKFYNLNFPPVDNVPTITNLYGPNNGHHKHFVHVVGNYTIQDQDGAKGCIYRGPLDNSGVWTTIIPSPLAPDDTVLNTICHSNMGNLVVGNYDTVAYQGKAFIYNIKTHQYYGITKSDAISITAYGIWHNSPHKYTICGGYTNSALQMIAYVVDWNNKTKEFKNWQSFTYNNNFNNIITHFDGITIGPTPDIYNLTGDWKALSQDPNELGFFCQIKRNKRTKKFHRKAYWAPITYPDKKATSGNSVYKDTVIGVYLLDDDPTVNGYISNLKKEHC